MSEAKDRRICPRSAIQVEARMYATVSSLGVEIELPEPRDPQIDSLIEVGKKLKPPALIHILSLDYAYAENNGMRMNPNLKSITEQIIRNNRRQD